MNVVRAGVLNPMSRPFIEFSHNDLGFLPSHGDRGTDTFLGQPLDLSFVQMIADDELILPFRCRCLLERHL